MTVLSKGPTESVGTTETMNPSRLASLMLEWESKRRELDAIETQIIGAVLAIGQSKTVGNVTAAYSKGRREYDYETPAKQVASPGQLAYFSKPVVDWKGLCESLKLEPVIVKQSPPSVTVKIKEAK